jgi:hypothetical protein
VGKGYILPQPCESNSNDSASATAEKDSPSPPPSPSASPSPSPAPTSLPLPLAYNGTSLVALNSDTPGSSIRFFYQVQNGDIRQAIYNNGSWSGGGNADVVTSGAKNGTSLSGTAYTEGGVFYVRHPKNRVHFSDAALFLLTTILRYGFSTSTQRMVCEMLSGTA